MIKTLSIIEISKETRKYQLILSPDSPLGECFDVLTEMRSEILKIINELSKESEAQANACKEEECQEN